MRALPVTTITLRNNRRDEKPPGDYGPAGIPQLIGAISSPKAVITSQEMGWSLWAGKTRRQLTPQWLLPSPLCAGLKLRWSALPQDASVQTKLEDATQSCVDEFHVSALLQLPSVALPSPPVCTEGIGASHTSPATEPRPGFGKLLTLLGTKETGRSLLGLDPGSHDSSPQRRGAGRNVEPQAGRGLKDHLVQS